MCITGSLGGSGWLGISENESKTDGKAQFHLIHDWKSPRLEEKVLCIPIRFVVTCLNNVLAVNASSKFKYIYFDSNKEVNVWVCVCGGERERGAGGKESLFKL